jgi:predicted ester cyclase
MTTASPADVMETLFDQIWNQGDLAQIEAIFAKPAPARQFISVFRAAFADLHHTIDETLLDGTRIAVRWHAEGTQSGPWAGHAASGRRIVYSGITIAQVEQGRIQRHHTEWDRAALLDQIMHDPI